MTTLTPAEIAILRVITASLVDLTTAEVELIAGVRLTTARRRKLAEAGLILATRVGRGYIHQAADAGAVLLHRLDTAARPLPPVEFAVRLAYAALGGGTVGLADLRARVAAPRAVVDATLIRMSLAGAHLRSEADQKTLTDRDRAAALMLAGTPRHTLLLAG